VSEVGENLAHDDWVCELRYEARDPEQAFGRIAAEVDQKRATRK
jgi:hypothetical protein